MTFFLSFGMYFWMVRLHTLIPSLSSSPQIRSAPHKRFSFTILRMRSIVSGGIFGSFGLRFDCHLLFLDVKYPAVEMPIRRLPQPFRSLHPITAFFALDLPSFLFLLHIGGNLIHLSAASPLVCAAFWPFSSLPAHDGSISAATTNIFLY